MMQQFSQEISNIKKCFQMSEEARKAERIEAEKVRKQDLKQLTEELFQKLQGKNTQPPFPANQERFY